MPHPAFRLVLAVALLPLLSSAAAAHEFELLLLAPQGAEAPEIDDMRAAFLIASHERDNHPDETSEGHLGGLDVQMTLATPGNAAPDAALAFVAAPLAAPGDAEVAALAAPGNAVIVDTSHLAALAAGPLQADTGLAAFPDLFRAATGRDPGEVAMGAYLAARAVDLAVRPLGGVDDRDGLRRSLAP